MDERVIRALRLCFNDAIDFDALGDRIAPIAFQAEAEDGGPVFEVVADLGLLHLLHPAVWDNHQTTNRVPDCVARVASVKDVNHP